MDGELPGEYDTDLGVGDSGNIEHTKLSALEIKGAESEVVDVTN